VDGDEFRRGRQADAVEGLRQRRARADDGLRLRRLGGVSQTLTGTLVVQPAGLTGTSASVSGAAFTALSGALVGTFTDGNALETSAADFNASIDWGDGTRSPGAVSYSGGVFSVRGDHAYSSAGSFAVTVSVDASSGAAVVIDSTAAVSGTVSATPQTISAIQGASTGAVTVASFTATTHGPFTASIDWGDGHQSAAAVSVNDSGGYDVRGGNTFAVAAADGPLPVTVRIFDNGTLAAVVTGGADVTPAPLSGIGMSLDLTQGVAPDGLAVARFTDPNQAPDLGAYSATIDWGDGGDEGPEDATIIPESGGTFAVTGAHAYDRPGSYAVTVTVDGPAGTQSVTTTATVARAAPEVDGLSLAWGPTQGGDVVTISGANLLDASAVTFGSTAAAAFQVNDDGTITAIAPALSAGSYDVTVTTPYGSSAVSSADLFTAASGAAPSVTSLGATSGPAGGGTSVTITGAGFASATAVSFGGAAADFTVDSDTQITAYAPEASASTIDVVVTTAFGSSSTSSADQYTYVGTAPAVSSLDAGSGPAAGGALLTVKGTDFGGATSVSFGSTSTTDFVVADSQTIFVTTPALTAGSTYHVTVTTPYGVSSTSSADQYTAVAAPAVTGLGTSSGPTGGGASVSISGSGFTGADQVLFGGQPAAFTVNSDSSITATAPASDAAGTIDVTILGPGGVSAAVSADHYAYAATAPSVSALGADRGPTAGGTAVVITGADFNGATAVTFGGTAAADFTVDSPTQITATAPAGSPGSGHVVVTTPFGSSGTSSSDLFTWADAAAPTVTSLGTTSGAMAGGTSVSITGTGFTAAQSVTFGGAPAASFTVNSSTSITAVAPMHVAGAAEVVVSTPYGSSASGYQDRFTFLVASPAVTSLGTSTGTTAGGTSVTISGSDFTGATQVLFGSAPATFTINSDSSITATSPVAASGTIDVTVVSPWGGSAASTADHFAFTAASGAPAVSGLSASSGPSGGGTAVTITGSGFDTATRVAFGSLTATSFTINSPTSITAVAPPGAPATIDVTVTNASGVSASSSADHFTWTAAAPLVSGVTPGSGTGAGGELVTITGSNLDGATAVSFGGTDATFTVNSPTQITATVPALAPASYHVTVTTGHGSSSTSSADLFTAVSAAAPAVTALSVTSGTTAGGTTVVLTGVGFTSATQVLFGSVAASFTVNSDTQITATTPAEAEANVDVTVAAPGGTSYPGDGTGFSFSAGTPAVTGLGTTSGPTSGGTSVAITGSGFTGAIDVTFGDSPATLFVVNSDTSITAYSPLAAASTVHVRVETAGGTSSAVTADQFTYNTSSTATPAVSGLSTSTGPSSGTTAVTVSGSNLGGATEVLFGDVPAASFSVTSGTSIVAVAPPQAAGTVAHVVVITQLGVSAATGSDQFTYQTAAPTVTAVSPSSGDTAGGVEVTLTGTNFATATDVTFGGASSPSFAALSNTSLVAVVPTSAVGVADVQVTNPDGTSATSSADQYTISSTSGTPTATALGTSSGPSGGGTSVAITGTNFTDITGVYFGAEPAASFSVASSTSITAASPAHASGTIDVTVATASGVSSAVSADHFTFNATAPAVSGLDVTSGPTAGGSTVVITGSNFNGATAVTFGTTAAASFTVDSPTRITATSPAGSAGAAHVVVTSPYGTSSTSSADLFTYVNAPTVSALSVSSGTTAGGTSVTITGTNFSGLVSVTFGGLYAASLTVSSSTSITATTPAAAPGVADVVVATALGASAVSDADQFTFETPVPAVTSLSASSGPLAGGATVTVTGSGFTGADLVLFGSLAAPSFTVTSDTSITATAPAGEAAGAIDVRVDTPGGGISDVASGDVYTYVAAPAVTGLSPSAGALVGGTSVVITGTGFTGASSVKFGAASASFTVNSDTQVTATAPSGSAGVVDVTITTAGGASPVSSADRYTYTNAPTVSGMTPATDTASGGVPVTVTGSNLSGATSVTFGGTAADFTVVSNTSLVVTAPAHAAGGVTVSVSGPGGSASAGTFTYTSATTVTWVGASTGDWGTGSNWSTGLTPSSGQDVVIGSGDTVTLSSGTPEIHRLTVAGALVLSGGTLTIDALSTAASLTLGGGSIYGAGKLTVTSSFAWSDGSLNGSSDFVIASGATLTLDTSAHTPTLFRRLVNDGAVSWATAGTLSMFGAWVNESGSTFTMDAPSGGQTISGTLGVMTNRGTMTKQGTGTTTFSFLEFDNSGAVDVQAGALVLATGTNSSTISVSSGATLRFGDSYTLASASTVSGSGAVTVSGGTLTMGGTITASTFTINSGATAQGAATINADVTNNGTLIVGASGAAGRLTINGNFTQGSGGTLTMEIGGAAAGTGYDRLAISGAATLAGTLNVSYAGGFTPSSGQAFALLTDGSRSGAFGGIMGGAWMLTPQYNSGDFSLLAWAAPDDPPPEEDGPPEGEGARPERVLVLRQEAANDWRVGEAGPAAPAPAGEYAQEEAIDLVFAGADRALPVADGGPNWEDVLALPVDLPAALLEALLEALA
jgi:hypothetical protein